MQSFFLRITKTPVRLRGCAGRFESSLGSYVIRYIFSRWGSYYFCCSSFRLSLVIYVVIFIHYLYCLNFFPGGRKVVDKSHVNMVKLCRYLKGE